MRRGTSTRDGRLRVDGWAGYQAGVAEGMLETRPFVADGKLWINADARKGEIRVEVHEVIEARPGQPLKTRVIPGFESDACQPITGDNIRARVSWQSADWEQLRGKTVLLRIAFRNATFYSFGTSGKNSD